MAEGDHTENPARLAFPLGNASLVWLQNAQIYCPNGLTTTIVARFLVPFDCYVREVWMGYTGGTADVDAVVVGTVDASKTIVASQDMGSDIAMTKQTLHANVAKDAYELNGGDTITVSVDTSATNESGYLAIAIGLRPKFAGYKGI
jgi:hypothetical protein